jgi:hypothetical protein
MTAQQVIWKAYSQGVTIWENGRGGLLLAPSERVGPDMVKAVQVHKPELTALIADLEQHGVADDGLILEALALFNAKLGGWQPSHRMPLEASKRPVDCTEAPEVSKAWLELGAA